MNIDLCYMPATELAARIRARSLSPVEIVEAVFERIRAVNPALNAFCTLTEEAARGEARAAEAAVVRGDRLGPLHGVPVSVKDLVITRGVRTMRGSRIYERAVPDEDAPSVARLKAAGAIMLGKTSTPEFGWKGTTESPATGVSVNPWDLSRTPGGSSGGAGAAVAAGLGPLAIGTDGGGSIRIPASFCGVFGLKPTFGRVAAYPPSAVALLSHVGPMARTVRDAALMLSCMAGPDARDPYSLPEPMTDLVAACDAGVRGLRVAWSPTLGFARVDAEVAERTASAARVFERELGCAVEQFDRPFDDPLPFFEVMWVSGLGAFVQPYLAEWADQMDPGLVDMARRIGGLSAADLAGALAMRMAFWRTSQAMFERFDLLLTPAMPVAAFKIGQPPRMTDRVPWAAWTPFTYPFNITGQPAASVPCGFTSDGLPVGLQIVGRRFEDALVLRAAAAFEAARPWADARPRV